MFSIKCTVNKNDLNFLRLIEDKFDTNKWSYILKHFDSEDKNIVKEKYEKNLFSFFSSNKNNKELGYSYRLVSDENQTLFRIEIYYSSPVELNIYFFCNDSDLSSNGIKDHDTFFFNLYKSLPNGLGYVSWVDIGDEFDFDEKHELDKYNVYTDFSYLVTYFYHCVSTPISNERHHTKEQLLNSPFIKVEEWEDGSIEMLHYNNPLDIESEENIEQFRKVRKYLSENNLYS